MSDFTPLRVGAGTIPEDNAMKVAASVWADEMIDALLGGYVPDGENPTARIEAFINVGSKRFLATLTYSVRRAAPDE